MAGLKNVAYYALGGGHGHTLRGLAILRRLQTRRIGVLLLAPRRLQAWAKIEGIRITSPPDRPSPETLMRWVSDTLSREAPDRLLVDVFPRGILADLHHSLALAATPPWLIARRVKPAFYLEPAIREVVEHRYERIVWCEEPPDSLRDLRVPQGICAPICVRNSEECNSRTVARQALGLPDAGSVVIVLGTGAVERQRDLLRLLLKVQAGIRTRFSLVFVSDTLLPHRENGLSVLSLYPAMASLRAADLVVAAGGYAAFHETRAVGIPTIYLPQRRPYDDQRWRVRQCSTVSNPRDLAIAIAAALRRDRVSSAGAYPASGADELADQLVAHSTTTGAGPSTPGFSSDGVLPSSFR